MYSNMKVLLLLHTIYYLKLKQIIYQLKNRLIHSFYTDHIRLVEKRIQYIYFIDKLELLQQQKISTLNLSDTFTSWNETKHGMLWAYNLNYMDWLMQKDMIVLLSLVILEEDIQYLPLLDCFQWPLLD